MFAYLIIAAELLVLYTVFWYIFLREPKPYRIKGEMWGRYENNALARYFESLEHEFQHEANASPKDAANMNRLQTMAIAKAACPQLQGAGSNRGYCANAKKYAQNYGWIEEDPKRLQGNPLKFAILMVEKLGNLSSRRP